MKTVTIKFTTKKANGTKFGGLRVQKYVPPGSPPARAIDIRLVNGKGTKPLEVQSTYVLSYGYYGEPGGTFEITVTAPDGTKLLEEKDTIPEFRLADSGKFPFVTP